MRLTILCVALLLATGPALAGWGEFLKRLQTTAAFYDGNMLHEACSQPLETIEGEGCYGMVFGILEAVAMFTRQGVVTARFCLPDGAKTDQIIRVVIDYLNDHPEQWHYSSAYLTVESLGIAFPCPPAAESSQLNRDGMSQNGLGPNINRGYGSVAKGTAVEPSRIDFLLLNALGIERIDALLPTPAPAALPGRPGPAAAAVTATTR